MILGNREKGLGIRFFYHKELNLLKNLLHFVRIKKICNVRGDELEKNEFLMLLRDADICMEIFNIIRHSGRPTGSAITASVDGPPNKVAILSLLHDVDVCKEIFYIILRGGKPPTEETPQPKQITSNGSASAAMSLREQIRNRLTNKNKPAASATSTTPAKPVDRKSMLNDRLKFLKEKNQATKEDSVVDNSTSEQSEVSYTIIAEKVCPICGKKTRVVQVKTRLNAETIDIDFCTHYQNFNPYLYGVWICEHCGYTADEVRFQEPMPSRVRKAIQEFLAENDFKTPFVEVRDKEEALTLYEMAIYFLDMFEKSAGRQAILYQKMAWICRLEYDNEKEQEYLLKCAELFEKSVNNERYPIGKMTDNVATYIIGVNYFMVGDMDKATRFISSIITSNQIRTQSPKLYEKARDVWQDIRAQRSAGKS